MRNFTKYAICIFIAFISEFAFCDENTKKVNFFTFEKPAVKLHTDIQFNVLPDLKNSGIGFSETALVDMKELVFQAGIKQTGTLFDASAEVVYWPTFNNWLNFGVGVIYHFYNYPDEFHEHDILASFYFNFDISKVFKLYFRIGNASKIAVVNEVSKAYGPVLEPLMVSLDLIASFYLGNGWRIFQTFSTNKFYDYPAFDTFFFTLGFDKQISKSLVLGFNITSKWTDLVIVSHNMTHFACNIDCKWSF